jgi:hypothetical protein
MKHTLTSYNIRSFNVDACSCTQLELVLELDFIDRSSFNLRGRSIEAATQRYSSVENDVSHCMSLDSLQFTPVAATWSTRRPRTLRHLPGTLVRGMV